MHQGEQPQSQEDVTKKEKYVHGYNAETVERHQGRTAQHQASFFIPHLKRNMNVLDCGCGPGTITVGLAQLVGSGEVVGIDMGSEVIEKAQAFATQQGISNVRFEEGNVYELPFPDNSFDAVFSHNVLEHLADPLKALTQMKRVLKPAGVIGARNTDIGGFIVEPTYSEIEHFFDLYEKVWKHNGGHPRIGRALGSLFRQAGFRKVELTGSYDIDATPEAIKGVVALIERRLVDLAFSEQVIAQGWADRAILQKMSEATEGWGKQPNSLFAASHFEALAWK